MAKLEDYLQRGKPAKLFDGLGNEVNYNKNTAPKLIVTFGRFGDVFCYSLVLYSVMSNVYTILQQETTTDKKFFNIRLLMLNEALLSASFIYLGDDKLDPEHYQHLSSKINFKYG